MPTLGPSPYQLAEYSWEQELEGRQFPVKVRVFLTPRDLVSKARGKYYISVLIGGDWWPSGERDYQPSEAELRAIVSARMPTWKNIGVI